MSVEHWDVSIIPDNNQTDNKRSIQLDYIHFPNHSRIAVEDQDIRIITEA